MTNAEQYYHSLLTFGMRPGLDRIKLLLKRLNNPQSGLRYIHVAGTNGKGTVCVFIDAILRKAGYKTGLFTSPYIMDFRERIRVNGEMISESELENITAQVKTEIDNLNLEGIIITEFEAVTAAAFLYYKRCNCDFVVLETGLGGRFDATNVIEKPDVSVITSISYDHVKVLGGRLEDIAAEKCGIIKKKCTVVTCSNQEKSVMKTILENSYGENAPLRVAEAGEVAVLSEATKGSRIRYKGLEVVVPLPGDHQVENCILALECIQVLRDNGAEIPDNAIQEGMATAKNPARCEILSDEAAVILDGCHNEGSARALATVLGKYYKNRKIKAVMGMMSDKAIDKVLDILLPYFVSVVTVKPGNPRAISAEDLKEKILSRGVFSVSENDPVTGTLNAVNALQEDEVLVICGSLYLCADVRECLIKRLADSSKDETDDENEERDEGKREERK